jgi:hypothetical protein
VPAAVVLYAASPELADHANGLLEPFQPHRGRGPRIAEDVLVQILAAAHAEEEPSGHQCGRRGSGLRDDGRMNPRGRAGDARPEPERLRHASDRADHAPNERAVSLTRYPRVVVIGDQRKAKPCFLAADRVPHERRGRMFFGSE